MPVPPYTLSEAIRANAKKLASAQADEQFWLFVNDDAIKLNLHPQTQSQITAKLDQAATDVSTHNDIGQFLATL